jgi:hypothetical protein
MKLEYCKEHSNCTIVDGAHTARRPAILPEGLAQQSSVDELRKVTNGRLTTLDQAITSRFADATGQIDDAKHSFDVAVADVKAAIAKVANDFAKFKEATEARFTAEKAERTATPDRIKTLLKRNEAIERSLKQLQDRITKTDEAVEKEALAREASIRQLVEL